MLYLFFIMKTVIGFVGLPGAGKSTAIEIARNFAPVVVMGDVVRDEAKSQKLPINSINLGNIAKTLRSNFGNDIIANRCVQKITNLSDPIIIIDGLRSNHEVVIFQKHFRLIIIAIVAPDSKRHQWIHLRKRGDDGKTLESIIKRDQRELNFGVADVIQNANFTIENHSSISELQTQCKSVFKEIGLID